MAAADVRKMTPSFSDLSFFFVSKLLPFSPSINFSHPHTSLPDFFHHNKTNKSPERSFSNRTRLEKEICKGGMDFLEEESSFPPGWSAAIKELAPGLDSVKKLESLLQLGSPENRPPLTATAALLVEEIKGAISKAMAELKAGSASAANQADSPSCVTSSKQCAAGKGKAQRSTRAGGYRRRGSPYSCTKIFSTTVDDGHTWRKYGQKEIYSAKYPRSYFRCTHKFDQGCKASKQVQRSEEDPSLFVITYFGDHTCVDAAKAMSSCRVPCIISFESKSGGNVEQETLSSLLPPKQECEEEALSNISFANSPEAEFKECGEEQTAKGCGADCGEFSSGLASDLYYGMDFGDFEDLFSYDHNAELFEFED